MGIKHAFTSAKSDGGDSTLVRPSDWNADHTISGLDVAFIGCYVRRTTNWTGLTTPSDFVAVPFDDSGTEVFDTDGFHSISSNTERLTIPAGLGGKYLITASGLFDTTKDTGVRAIAVVKTPGSVLARDDRDIGGASGAYSDSLHVACIADLAAGDYIDLRAFHSITGTVNVLGHADAAYTFISIAKLDSGKVGQGIGASLTKSGVQSEASGAAAITFDGETFDTDGFHDNSTNNTRMTIPAGLGGKYLLNGSVEIASLADQKSIIVRFRKNGATYVEGRARVYASGSTFASPSHSAVVDLAAGDWVELMAEHNDTVNCDYRASADGTSFSIMRLDSGGGSERIPGLAASPDILPASPSAYNDEFTNLTGWTTLGSLNTSNATDAASHWHVIKASVGLQIHGIYKAGPAVPYAAIVKITDYSTWRGDYTEFGLGVGDSTPTAWCTFSFSSYNQSIQVDTWTNNTTRSSSANGTTGSLNSLPKYLCMAVNSSTSIDCWFSSGGMVWALAIVGSNPGFTPSKFGLVVSANGKEAEAFYDYVRFYTGTAGQTFNPSTRTWA